MLKGQEQLEKWSEDFAFHSVRSAPNTAQGKFEVLEATSRPEAYWP